jgi:hypothetical protein
MGKIKQSACEKSACLFTTGTGVNDFSNNSIPGIILGPFEYGCSIFASSKYCEFVFAKQRFKKLTKVRKKVCSSRKIQLGLFCLSSCYISLLTICVADHCSNQVPDDGPGIPHDRLPASRRQPQLLQVCPWTNLLY